MKFADAAPIIYVLILLWMCACLWRGHRQGAVDLWDLITVTDKQGKKRTDAGKFQETGAFLVMTVTFAFLGVLDKLTEMYAGIYVGAWVTARALSRGAKVKEALGVQSGTTTTETASSTTTVKS